MQRRTPDNPGDPSNWDANRTSRRLILDYLACQDYGPDALKRYNEKRSFDEFCIQLIRQLLNRRLLKEARLLSHQLKKYSELNMLSGITFFMIAVFEDRYNGAALLASRLEDKTLESATPLEFLRFLLKTNPDPEYQVSHKVIERLRSRRELTEALYITMKSSALKSSELIASAMKDSLTTHTHHSEDNLSWVLPWYEALKSTSQSQRSNPDEVCIGIVDLQSNPNDSRAETPSERLETLAATLLCVGEKNIRFRGDGPLTKMIEELHFRINHYPEEKPHPGRGSQPREVRVVAINRDYSRLQQIPKHTWTIISGPLPKAFFNFEQPFFNENILPLFIGISIEDGSNFSASSIEYLTHHGPIGCKDWRSVYLLTKFGVDCYYSGPISLLSERFQHIARLSCDPEPSDDLPFDFSSEISAKKILSRALASLGQLSRSTNFHAMDVTMLLLASLLEKNVTAPNDVSSEKIFAKSSEPLITDPQRLANTTNLLQHQIDTLRSLIFSSSAPSDVYRDFRNLCLSQVKRSRNRAMRPIKGVAPTNNIYSVVEDIRKRTVYHGPVERPGLTDKVNVAISVDATVIRYLHVLIHSILRNTKASVIFWILTRRVTEDDIADLYERFPDTEFRFFPCESSSFLSAKGLPPRISPSALDRLLLPVLMESIDKVIYLDVDTLVLDDIADLYGIQLGDAPLAARPAVDSPMEAGLQNLYSAGRRVSAQRSLELFRRALLEFSFRFTTFNSGVLVMNLDIMRQDQFCDKYLSYSERYWLNDQELLNFYAGTRYRALDSRWNASPLNGTVTQASILHWAGSIKPWDSEYIDFSEEWHDELALLNRHATS